MDGLRFRDVFKGKLKFWSLHCAISALPSYLIVMVLLKQAGNPTAHFAMLAAVATFVIGYSVLTSLLGPLTRKDSLLSRALRVGLIVRMIISIFAILAIPTKNIMVFIPDFWCGMVASSLVNVLYDYMGNEAYIANFMSGSGSNVQSQVPFVEVYLVTLLEGLMLSFMLFIFSLIAVVILQMRDRKKFFVENYQNYKSGLD